MCGLLSSALPSGFLWGLGQESVNRLFSWFWMMLSCWRIQPLATHLYSHFGTWCRWQIKSMSSYKCKAYFTRESTNISLIMLFPLNYTPPFYVQTLCYLIVLLCVTVLRTPSMSCHIRNSLMINHKTCICPLTPQCFGLLNQFQNIALIKKPLTSIIFHWALY